MDNNFLYRIGRIIPDKQYLSIKYYKNFRRFPRWSNPQTFSEKLQWLKLYDRKPEYTIMVDKYAVKEYVANIIGSDYIIPTLGVWDSPELIDWNILPNKFVLKCTHDSGTVIVVKDKSKLDIESTVKKLKHWMSRDFYAVGREWPYKDVPRRILAEQYIDPAPNVQDLPDYKWYCFNGVPKFCQVIQNRNTKETIDFFDTEWKHQDFIGLAPDAVHAEVLPEKPVNLETHLRITRELSKDIPFSRIDLYETGERTYFGEITFYPASGMGKFRPIEYNEILGAMITLW